MPSGVTSPAALWIRRSSGSRWLSMTPCTPVTQTYCRSRRAIHPWMADSACSMSIALTPTPSTSTRRGGSADSAATGAAVLLGDSTSEGAVGCRHAGFDPLVGTPQSLFQRDLRFPAQHLTQPGVIAVAPPYALGSGEVVPLADPLARHAGHHVHQLVDRDQSILAEVERLAMVRAHEAPDALDAVIDVAVGPRLLPVAPDLDLVAIRRQRHLPADRGRGFLSSTFVGAQRPEDVVKPDHTSVEAMVFQVVPALPLREQLLPAVPVFRIGRVGILFAKRCDVHGVLPIAGIHAGRRGVEIALDAMLPRRLEHVDVDQHVVVHDHGLVVLDEADPAHVGGQVVDLGHPPGGLEGLLPAAQIEQPKLVRPAGLELGLLEIHSPNPEALRLEEVGQVVPDESPSAGDQDAPALHTASLKRP